MGSLIRETSFLLLWVKHILENVLFRIEAGLECSTVSLSHLSIEYPHSQFHNFQVDILFWKLHGGLRPNRLGLEIVSTTPQIFYFVANTET